MNSGQIKSRHHLATRKVELHRHLDCSMRFSTFCEIAPQVGIEIPSDVAVAKEKFLVLSPMRDLPAVLQKFLATQKALANEQILERLIYETIEDSYNEGIRIMEFRWAPSFIRDGHPHLQFDRILAAFQRGQERALKKYPMAIGHLGILQRILPMKDLNSILDFFIQNKGFFVGIDLADDELAKPARDFVSLFSRAHTAGLPATVHAGEAANAPQAIQNVIDAIEILGAKRIGHGLQIIHSEAALKFVREKQIPLELCPWSNVLTQAVSDIDAHPFKKLMAAGIRVTINSDDPGIFHSDLTREYDLLAEHFRLSEKDFAQCNEWAFEASFIPQAIKEKYWRI